MLTRREVEARLVAPLVEALATEFGRDKVLRVIREAVVKIARRQGAELALAKGGESLSKFRESLVHWTRGKALEVEVVEEGENVFAFNVTRCRYAEMYRDLGIPRLGPILSCSRDFALIEGFNPGIRLTRTQTLMEGAPFCDFRYRLEVG
ncbi:MAG: L-2-amino-thiazoline-4-carboxylic acid hydrolase [Deltaproteobacteria bacterium]|nr:L-2-amino-thiazoline-4-carboxylic acid hydrolase [Deltaproteobacteria bacterium]